MGLSSIIARLSIEFNKEARSFLKSISLSTWFHRKYEEGF